MFFKAGVLRDFDRKTPVPVSFSSLQLYSKETLAQLFSCKFFKYTFFTEHVRTTVSEFFFLLWIFLKILYRKIVLFISYFLFIAHQKILNCTETFNIDVFHSLSSFLHSNFFFLSYQHIFIKSFSYLSNSLK